jgi:hypothetical protein
MAVAHVAQVVVAHVVVVVVVVVAHCFLLRPTVAFWVLLWLNRVVALASLAVVRVVMCLEDQLRKENNESE